MGDQNKKTRSSLRQRADQIKKHRCKNLIAVLEEPNDYKNIGKVIRNINALGVEKLYVVDSRSSLPEKWEELRSRKKLARISASAVKWTYVKTFKSTKACLDHLKQRRFVSMATSPHVKDANNVILHEGTYTQIRLAVWFGNESRGVSDEVIKESIACINIPMFGIIESLNLATSTGIVLYEVAKQRRAFQEKFKRGQKRFQREI